MYIVMRKQPMLYLSFEWKKIHVTATETQLGIVTQQDCQKLFQAGAAIGHNVGMIDSVH